jgi:hypothetical protein
MKTSSSNSFSTICLCLVLLLCIDNGASFSPISCTTRLLISEVPRQSQTHVPLWSSKMGDEDDVVLTRLSTGPHEAPSESEEPKPSLRDNKKRNREASETPSLLPRMMNEIPFIHLLTEHGRKKLPPAQVDDVNLLIYDVFLIVNLALSISFWVTHRLDFTFLPLAFNEGCLFSILWIVSGLYHGSFLYSALDGHFPPDTNSGRGGPKDAAALAFNTYINAINLRLIAALVGAWVQHRKVGLGDAMEQLIPLEVGCGLVLMTLWRALHSSFSPRI